ncbi:MAG: anti-phage dCTP deaminase [Candidatus Hinthialibacter antarcticus]|nr:anti-phage dCTP deaminase [Candidatus Hinthialibacter antarcticus]
MSESIHKNILENKFADSELVIGLVGAVGSKISHIASLIKDELKEYKYTPNEVRVSKDVIQKIDESIDLDTTTDEFSRTTLLMDAGNKLRKNSKNNSILALGAVSNVYDIREDNAGGELKPRNAYIINSLKHPEEVALLRTVYPDGFFLIGIFSDENERKNYLKDVKHINDQNASNLIDRDQDENLKYGQKTRETFHLSDFFIYEDDSDKLLASQINRIFCILFGYPYATPTFDEYAMFMAYSSSLRSADLSRQVGAVITNNNLILSTGANDCPKFGGGLYWQQYNNEENKYIDEENGRDYKKGFDSNKIEKEKIIDEITKQISEKLDITESKENIKNILKDSGIGDITEYGRVVHAEMEAILSCARQNINCVNATLYCTTFPCHNCAKHIVAAGIKRVVYVEPYPKSKAEEFHSDSIELTKPSSINDSKVRFEPFIGVGPRKFFDLFSMNLSSGFPLTRKDDAGKVIKWDAEKSKLRVQMIPSSYIGIEKNAAHKFNVILKESGLREAKNGK